MPPEPSPATAIVPLKALTTAKGRLAGELDPATRRALAAWMFGRVIDACRAARCVDDVLVVAGDEAAAALARERDVRAVLEPHPGLAAALATADAVTRDRHATIVVAADLPLARGADLDAVWAALPGTGVAVAPTRDGGTGALLRRPPAVIGTRYGPDSAAAHLRLAREAGVPARTVAVPALALDVDTPRQLREAADLDGTASRWVSALRPSTAG